MASGQFIPQFFQTNGRAVFPSAHDLAAFLVAGYVGARYNLRSDFLEVGTAIQTSGSQLIERAVSVDAA